ncbi:MAG: hypothetical protein ABJH04_07820 [Cyclobacteriaceae bacterium]
MKKVLVIITAFALTFSISSCTEEQITPQAGEGGQPINHDNF